MNIKTIGQDSHPHLDPDEFVTESHYLSKGIEEDNLSTLFPLLGFASLKAIFEYANIKPMLVTNL